MQADILSRNQWRAEHLHLWVALNSKRSAPGLDEMTGQISVEIARQSRDRSFGGAWWLRPPKRPPLVRPLASRSITAATLNGSATPSVRVYSARSAGEH